MGVLLSYILKLFIPIKYKKKVIHIHQNNLTENKIIAINIFEKTIKNKLAGILRKSFHKPILVSNKWIYFFPAAIIVVPETHKEYLNFIGDKSRNMIRKANKVGMVFKSFIWNDFLNDIYAINTSAQFRQRREMDATYRYFPQAVDYPHQDEFSIVHIGGFMNDVLIGYIELYIYSNFAMTNRVLGHKDYLNQGLMNGLFSYVIEFAIIHNRFRFLNYLTMLNKESDSLSGFKYRVGFREYSIIQMA
jgi:hypothetical protein